MSDLNLITQDITIDFYSRTPLPRMLVHIIRTSRKRMANTGAVAKTSFLTIPMYLAYTLDHTSTYTLDGRADPIVYTSDSALTLTFITDDYKVYLYRWTLPTMRV